MLLTKKPQSDSECPHSPNSHFFLLKALPVLLIGIGTLLTIDGFEYEVTNILPTGVELDDSRIIDFAEAEKLV